MAARIAAETMARRGIDYPGDVRRLLDAAFTVIERNGRTKRARVADIVAEAGLSNEAFYRYFPSKDALVTALIEDGSVRLASYLEHQMAKDADPRAKVRSWVTGVLSQASGRTAATTLAVLWNGSNFDRGSAPGNRSTADALGVLLREPLAALGSSDPVLDASLLSHAVLGKMSAHLSEQTKPSRSEIDRITRFCIAAVTSRQESSDPR